MVTYVPLDTPCWPEIESLVLYRAERAWSQAGSKLKTPKMWLVTKGQHEPGIDSETWLELQKFLDVQAGGAGHPLGLVYSLGCCGAVGAAPGCGPDGQRPGPESIAVSTFAPPATLTATPATIHTIITHAES